MKRVLLSMLVCMIVLLQRWLNRIVAILFILVGLLCCNPNNWTIFFTLTAVFHCFLVLLPLEEGI